MPDDDLLQRTLDLVVERVGDPAPLVYQRVFAGAPELEAMFVSDTRGSVRAEMFLRALDAMLDLSRGQPYAAGMVACEWQNHAMNGVSARQFNRFFEAIVETCRDALGADWTPPVARAWQAALARVQALIDQPQPLSATPGPAPG